MKMRRCVYLSPRSFRLPYVRLRACIHAGNTCKRRREASRSRWWRPSPAALLPDALLVCVCVRARACRWRACAHKASTGGVDQGRRVVLRVRQLVVCNLRVGNPEVAREISQMGGQRKGAPCCEGACPDGAVFVIELDAAVCDEALPATTLIH